jgi:hypothetical protein
MFKTLLAGLLASLGALAIPADAGNLWPPRNYDPGVLVEWNALLVEAVPDDVGVMLPQYYALMHTAMYDAVVSIEGGHPARHHQCEPRAARRTSGARSRAKGP